MCRGWALLKPDAGYARRVIPKGIYEFQETDVKTFGTSTHLMVRGDRSDDLVYGIVEALATCNEAGERPSGLHIGGSTN